MQITEHTEHPLRNTYYLHAGASLDEARGVVIMIHGRGATAESMLPLAQEFEDNELAYLLPQAENYTWYPQGFMMPIESNLPDLKEALKIIDELLMKVEHERQSLEKVVLLGFSQGACLSSEYIARHGKPYGLVAFSGGVIGQQIDESNYQNSLDKIHAFLGCSDKDPHIPLERVNDTYAVYNSRGADIEKKIYPNMPHTVNQDEIKRAYHLINKITDEN